MFIVISVILVILFLIAAFSKIWMNRHALQSLTSTDWIQFTFGLLMSIAFASIVIIGGMVEMNSLLTGVIGAIIKVTVILVGLFIASALFLKLIPDKLKPFYKILDT